MAWIRPMKYTPHDACMNKNLEKQTNASCPKPNNLASLLEIDLSLLKMPSSNTVAWKTESGTASQNKRKMLEIPYGIFILKKRFITPDLSQK